MKKLIALLIFCCFPALADNPQAKLEYVNNNVQVLFNDFENAGPFERYKCHIHINDWLYTMNGEKVSDGLYKCQDYGYMQLGQDYLVWISFTDWPYGWSNSSQAFWLKVE